MSERRRRRILLVTRNMPPLLGGMERLNWHMARQLSEVADVRVIGPMDSVGTVPEVPVLGVPLSPLWNFLLRARIAACRVARNWQPDIVLAGSGLTAPLADAAARSCGGQAVAYVHGLDVAVRNPVYRAVWLPAIRRMSRVIANSRATAGLCAQVGVNPQRIGIVHPGVELPDPEAAGGDAAGVRAELGLGERPLMVSVGRLTTRKGLLEFVSNALPRIVMRCPDVLFLVVGDAPRQALYASAQTPESILAAARQRGVDQHVRFLGPITDYRRLGAIYRAAQVHVFPVRELPGDPEGFGMVAVEAAAHGLPTVAFATGGVVDAVEDGASGRLVAPGDYAALADAALGVLLESRPWSRECARFAAGFDWTVFGRKVASELESALADAPTRNSSAPMA